MERADIAAKTGRGDIGSLHFGKKLFTYGCMRVPEYSRLHPIIPRLYVEEWKTDMENRELLKKNADLGGVPTFEHDENLFLEKREQMHYNVENPNRVINKYKIPERAKLLRPDFHNSMSRYQSSLMSRRESVKKELDHHHHHHHRDLASS